MKIEIELSDRQAELLRNWPMPSEQCGSTLQERIDFVVDDWCVSLEMMEKKRRTSKLYTLLGLPDPTLFIDDDIPF